MPALCLPRYLTVMVQVPLRFSFRLPLARGRRLAGTVGGSLAAARLNVGATLLRRLLQHDWDYQQYAGPRCREFHRCRRCGRIE
jgi:hypothetical protein